MTGWSVRDYYACVILGHFATEILEKFLYSSQFSGGEEADSSHMELRASCLRAPFDLTGVAGLASVFADSTAVTLDLD